MNVDGGLDDIRWIRGLEGERLPAASYILFSNRGKGLLFPTGERSTICAVCFPPTARGHVFLYQTPDRRPFLYQTPGRRPTRFTGRVVSTVTREWVRAPNERPPLRIHDAVVGFVDRYLSRTHNLAASISFCLLYTSPSPRD